MNLLREHVEQELYPQLDTTVRYITRAERRCTHAGLKIEDDGWQDFQNLGTMVS
jgi:hypothetical protein